MSPLDWLRLYRTEKIGPAQFFRLLERFGDPGRALDALAEITQGRLTPYPMAAAEAELAALRRLGGKLLLAGDPDFPEGLRALGIAPLLMLRGDPALLRRPIIAIVGAREASAAGCKIARTLAADLSAAGYAIVSGLARGIDTAAHLGALERGTIGVLAGGVDHIYPAENAALYGRMIEQGCVLSEMPPGFQPQAAHFPRRNRLIAGLAAGVVVVEAKLRSGSLITARLALDQGREVFAVPGSPLEPRSQGPNSLIKQGAPLVECAEDILQGLGVTAWMAPVPAKATVSIEPALSDAQKLVEGTLSVTAVTVDEILRQCQLSPAILSMALLELELAGRLHRHPDHKVSLRR